MKGDFSALFPAVFANKNELRLVPDRLMESFHFQCSLCTYDVPTGQSDPCVVANLDPTDRFTFKLYNRVNKSI